MPPLDGVSGPQGSIPKALAFYLPQYHPIPENDEWWGKGFTEWANVTRARPLYPGHYQPHIPGELGYYDLRVPELRQAQADLARAHGIGGFVYYHYWFSGKQLLNRPFDEVLASGSPDFPFALCWANEEWTRNWDGQNGQVLIPQSYSDDDDLAHIRWLAGSFADNRYIKIDGKPLMLIYRPGDLPNTRRTTDSWRAEAQRLGFPDLYLCWVDGWGRPPGEPEKFGFDATVGFLPLSRERMFTPVGPMRSHRILDYVSSYETQLSVLTPSWKHFPSVMVGWDNTARHPRSATIFEGATPEHYKKWLEKTVASVADVPENENYIFIVAWNEWAEGNHLEPDLRFGRGFLEATRSVLAPGGDRLPAEPGATPGDSEDGLTVDQPGPLVGDSAISNLAGLVGELSPDPQRHVVNLCTGSDVERTVLLNSLMTFHAIEDQPELVRRMKISGIEATQCDIADFDSLRRTLEDLGDVGAFLLVDVLGKVAQPHQLLTDLSAWSLENGSPLLFVSNPNIAHFDLGLSLLFGEWEPTRSGLLSSEQLHLFTEATLSRMLDRCGWRVIARDDASSIQSDRYDASLYDRLPEEMIGALRSVSESYNPYWAVERYVWALAPAKVDRVPGSFYDAIAQDSNAVPLRSEAGRASVEKYLESIGLVASETSRRAVALGRQPRPLWKRALLRGANSNARSAAMFKRMRRWLR